MTTHKSFCLTWNAQDEERYNSNVETLTEFKDTFGYKRLIMAHEVGSKGNKHIQGAIVYNNPRKLSTVINQFPGAHIEVMGGKWKDQVDYCTKECKPFIHVVNNSLGEEYSYWKDML